jgi:hypothetical protein
MKVNSTTTYSFDPLTPTAAYTVEKQVTEGLEFILSHLTKPYWPRTISTKLTEGRQFTISSKLEALSYFKDSNYVDCRISAYSVEKKKKTVNFIMIDLDQSNFKSKRELESVKTKTLSKISEIFEVNSTNNVKNNNKSNKQTTVIWSGNGYHFYTPCSPKGRSLEQTSEFKKLVKEPDKEFLRFAEWYLSDGKCDNEHNKTVSFNNCMLRIPGSFNSKNNVQVRVVQEWNGISKVQLSILYGRFLAYLIDNNNKKNNCKKKSTKYGSKTHNALSEHISLKPNVLQKFFQRRNKKNNNKATPWIERLLKIPVCDHRKYCIWRILAPYFVNVKHLSFDDSYDKIYQWLDGCDELRALDFDPRTKINDSLNRAADSGYLPISFDNPLKEPRTLKTDNRELYNIIKVWRLYPI